VWYWRVASLFLEQYRDIEYFAIEFSEKMRELASQRCTKRGGRIQLLNQDLNQPLPPGPFDLVVSFFAIHHARDKRRLIGDVYDRLGQTVSQSVHKLETSGGLRIQSALRTRGRIWWHRHCRGKFACGPLGGACALGAILRVPNSSHR
jgi:SAM-dependent methyltransferase